jgi:glycosyltransferase involved in cell wall biosynthesis
VRDDIPQIELIHSFSSFSYIRIPFLPFITKTIMISKKRIGDHQLLYDRFKIPSRYRDRINYIPNAIILPAEPPAKDINSFTVLYSGRATKEKRVHLVTEIAGKLQERNENIKFEIAGDITGAIRDKDHPFVKFYGNISNEKLLQQIYSKAHVLLLTSSTEGFPMVIMEAMAHGCAILSTGVGDIPYHVKENENGFLFSSVEDTAIIVKEAIDKISWLKKNSDEWQRISRNNINYAKQHFGIERFNKDYRELFSSVKQTIETA